MHPELGVGWAGGVIRHASEMGGGGGGGRVTLRCDLKPQNVFGGKGGGGGGQGGGGILRVRRVT